jgi:hypothetical protein
MLRLRRLTQHQGDWNDHHPQSCHHRSLYNQGIIDRKTRCRRGRIGSQGHHSLGLTRISHRCCLRFLKTRLETSADVRLQPRHCRQDNQTFATGSLIGAAIAVRARSGARPLRLWRRKDRQARRMRHRPRQGAAPWLYLPCIWNVLACSAACLISAARSP